MWFVPVASDPGPPYGRAYGHWKKWKHDRKTVLVLKDVDVRHLVAVRMVHDYYGVPADAAMKQRAGGKNVKSLMASEYVKRHGPKANEAKRSTESKGKKGGGEHGKGHGKGSGKK